MRTQLLLPFLLFAFLVTQSLNANISMHPSFTATTMEMDVSEVNIASATGSITGDYLVLSTGSTYSLRDAQATSWRGTSGVQLVSSTATSAVFKSVSSGSAETIEAVTASGVISYSVWAGAPVIQSVSGSLNVGGGSSAMYTAVYDSKSLPKEIEWEIYPSYSQNVFRPNGLSSCTILFNVNGRYKLYVRGRNENGWGPTYETDLITVTGARSASAVEENLLDAAGSITGNYLVLNTGTTYTLRDAQATSWRGTSGVQLVSSTATSAVFKAVSTGSVETIEAVTSGGVVSYTVWAGPPAIQSVTGPMTVLANGQSVNYTATYEWNSLPQEFKWEISPSYSDNTFMPVGLGLCTILFKRTGGYKLSVSARNQNGWGRVFETNVITVQGSGYSFSNEESYVAYPNPASDILTINNKVDNYVLNAEHQSYSVKLYNSAGSIVRNATSQGEQIQLNVADLPEGFYYLHIYDADDKNIDKQTIIIKH